MSKLTLILIVISLAEFSQAISKLSALRQSVFLGYDKLVLPDEPVKVRFGFTLLNIDVCPHKQVNSKPSLFEEILLLFIGNYLASSSTPNYVNHEKQVPSLRDLLC